MTKNKNKSNEIQTEKISKMAIDEKDLKSSTIPNPVVVGGLSQIGLHRIPPLEIPLFLFMHPALPRGIEIKANRMIKLTDENVEQNVIINPNEDKNAKEARGYCRGILHNSGGPLYIKKMTTGAYRFGTSFSVLQTNKAVDEVLKFEYQHEIFFGAARYPSVLKGPDAEWGDIPMFERPFLAGKLKIDKLTKKIDKYTQLTIRHQGVQGNKQSAQQDIYGGGYNFSPGAYETNYHASQGFVNTRTHPGLKSSLPGPLAPIGKEFDQSEVIQLAFDTLGDEPLGIPLVQFLHLTIKYLLNMERAGAQTMVNFGFNKYKAMTPFKDINKMQAFAKTLANIQKDSVVVLPEGITLENIAPGTTEFDRIHPIYLQLIAMRLGIPMSILTQTGTETNKATIQEQRKDMWDDFRADELTIEATINDGFFKACQIKWPELSVKEIDDLVPKFIFKQPPEDLDSEMDRDLKFSLMERNFSTGIVDISSSLETLKELFPNKTFDNLISVIDNIALKMNQSIIKSIGLDINQKSQEQLEHDKAKE